MAERKGRLGGVTGRHNLSLSNEEAGPSGKGGRGRGAAPAGGVGRGRGRMSQPKMGARRPSPAVVKTEPGVESVVEDVNLHDVIAACRQGQDGSQAGAVGRGTHPGKGRVDPRGMRGGRAYTTSGSFFSGGGGATQTGAVPAPIAATALPRVQDPSRHGSKVKVEKREGADQEDVKQPGKSRARRIQEDDEPGQVYIMPEEEDDNDSQAHPPIRLPLGQSQRLYQNKMVDIQTEKMQPMQLGYENPSAVQEEQLRAQALFQGHDDDNDKLFFVQLPSALPIGSMINSDAPVGGRSSGMPDDQTADEAPGGVGLEQQMGQAEWNAKLSSVEPGYMGKMRIHRSGRMSLSLGDVVYNVTPGMQSPFRQEVLVVDPDKGTCHALGAVQDKLVAKLDTEILLAKPRMR